MGNIFGALVLVLTIGGAGTLQAQPENAPADGTARDGASAGAFEVYDGMLGRWVEPLEFWLNYADRRGGLTWGRHSVYPPHRDVKELDTFMVELPQGPCLMEFFHERWRRANDVRRWNERFNDFGGCPHVFD